MIEREVRTAIAYRRPECSIAVILKASQLLDRRLERRYQLVNCGLIFQVLAGVADQRGERRAQRNSVQARRLGELFSHLLVNLG